MEKLRSKSILKLLGVFFLFELASFLAYLFPVINNPLFFLLAGAFLILALWKFDWAVLVLLGELFIGSKGYLLFFSLGGLLLSLRITFWLIIMAVWAARFILSWIKTKKFPLQKLAQTRLGLAYGLLFFFVIFGVVNALVHQQEFNNLFFPLYSVFVADEHRARNRQNLALVFLVAAIWLSVKTFIFLFFFSHNLVGAHELYLWLRQTGVGEITDFGNGFYRLFFQSHIYVVWAFILTLAYLAVSKKNIFWPLTLATVFLSVIILSLSRSFWVGLLGAGLFLVIMIWRSSNFKKILRQVGYWILIAIGSLILIFVVTKFPYPKSTGNFDLNSL